jgi:hypothetical protein
VDYRFALPVGQARRIGGICRLNAATAVGSWFTLLETLGSIWEDARFAGSVFGRPRPGFLLGFCPTSCLRNSAFPYNRTANQLS